MDPDDIDPSPLKHFVSGTGCGCGCIGLLTMLVGVLVIVMIPLRFFAPSWGSTLSMLAGTGLVAGLLMAVLGGVTWLASLLLD